MSHTHILAIDTTAAYGSIALVRDGALVEEVPMHSPEGFGQILFQHIAALLDRHGLKPQDIACFASATGPGSFTGVRIGLSAAKGLAESTGRKVAGVSNLRAIAAYGVGPLRAAVLDARRGEIYGAVYDSGLRIVQEEIVRPFAAWIDGLPDGVVEFVTQDATVFAGAIAGHPRFASAAVRQAPRALAGAIGEIAAKDGVFLDPVELDANYVRRSDAELMWKEA